MIDFDLHLPTRIIFGVGTLDQTGTHVREHGSHALVVTGRTAARTHGYLDRVVQSLTRAGIKSAVFEHVSVNPRSDEIDDAARLAVRRGIDVVIGLGGGSAIDAAKAIAVASGLGTTIRDLIGTTLDPHISVLPVIAIPTTAGSGSEVTKGAIITDSVRQFRAGVRGDALFPQVAIIDSQLLASVPNAVLAETAFDALAHAVEGAVAHRATPISRAISRQAIKLVITHLPPLLHEVGSAEDRDGLALAATLGGINVATVSTCLPHRLQQAMGSLKGLNISHGRGLAVVYPSWLRHTEPAAAPVFQEISTALGQATVLAAIEEFLESVNLSTRLSDWGVTASDLDILVDGVVGNLDNDPASRNIDSSYLRNIFNESL